MPLRVAQPTSPVLATWRVMLLGRLLFTVFGAAGLLLSIPPFVTDMGEYREWSLWFVLALSLAAMILPWRLVVRLHEDALFTQGLLLSHVIPLAEISLIAPDSSGLGIWWGDGHSMTTSFVGEQGLLSDLLGNKGKGGRIEDRILAARDAYLTTHGLTALPDPTVKHQQQVDDFWQGRPH